MAAVDAPRWPSAIWPRSSAGIVTLDSAGQAAGTISYELLTSLGPRLPRIYGQGDIGDLMRRAAIIVLDGRGHRRRGRTRTRTETRAATRSETSPERSESLRCPNSPRWGLGQLRVAPRRRRGRRAPSAAFGVCEPRSAGKDSTTGHWEICGAHARAALPHLPAGLSRRADRRVLPSHRDGACWATRPPQARRSWIGFGEEHRRTGQVDRLHLGRQRLPGGGARGHRAPGELYAACEAASALLQR